VNPLHRLWRAIFEDDNRPPEPDQLVVLGEPSNEAEAQLWRDMLDDAGIRSMARDVSPTAGYPSRGLPMMEVRVLQRDLDRAREIVRLGGGAEGPDARSP